MITEVYNCCTYLNNKAEQDMIEDYLFKLKNYDWFEN